MRKLISFGGFILRDNLQTKSILRLFLIALALVYSFILLPSSIAAEPSFPGIDKEGTVYRAYWVEYGKYLMKNAPDDIKNGTNIEKAKYIMLKVGEKAADHGITPNTHLGGRVSRSGPGGEPKDRGACGDMTNTMEDALKGAGITGVEQVVGNKTGLRSYNVFDVNRDHGTVGVFNKKGEICMFDLWQHGVDTGSFRNSKNSKWNCMDGQKWGKEMEKQNYGTFNRMSNPDQKFTGSDAVFTQVEKEHKEKKQAVANFNKNLKEAEATLKNCKFADVDSKLGDLIKVPWMRNTYPEFYKKAKALSDKAKSLQNKLNDFKSANTKAADDITNCKFGTVETALKPFISNKDLEGCKDEMKTAKELSEKAKKLKQTKEKAAKIIAKARTDIAACKFEIKGSLQEIVGNTDLAKCTEQTQAKTLIGKINDLIKKEKDVKAALARAEKSAAEATKAAQDAKTVREKIEAAKNTATDALTEAQNLLKSDEPALGEDVATEVDPEKNCEDAKKLAEELKAAADSANEEKEKIQKPYRATENAKKEACALAEKIGTAENKKELEALRDKAQKEVEKARIGKEEAQDIEKKCIENVKTVKSLKGKIDSLLLPITKGKADRQKVKEILSNSVPTEQFTLPTYTATHSEDAEKEKEKVLSLTKECFKELIPKANAAASTADTKEKEAKDHIDKAKTAKDDLEKTVPEINTLLGTLTEGDQAYSCDVGNIEEKVKEAEAIGEKADSQASSAAALWKDAEVCASRIRQAITTFEEEEEEPTDELPPSLAETEEVEDPGYLRGDCQGTITSSVTSGYAGDAIVYTITIKPPASKEIVRVTTNNPGCTNCDAKEAAPGKYTLAHNFLGKGPFRVTFLAFDKDGKERCSGSTGQLRGLGNRP